MSTILERAKAHYESLPRGELKIPEWGDHDGPLVITWSALTVRDQERIYEPGSDGKAVSGGLVRFRAVMLKSCDATGNLLFDGMSEHDLRHSVDGDIVGRIANAILYGAGLQKKNGDPKPVDGQIDDAKKV